MRLVDQAATQRNFVADDQVSPQDYLCSSPEDRIICTASNELIPADAASIMLGEESFEGFFKRTEPKPGKGSKAEHQKRMDRIQDLLNSPEFLEEVREAKEKVDAVQDDLTPEGEKVYIGGALKQMIVPGPDGDLLVSPLPPVSLCFAAGEILRANRSLYFWLVEKRENARDLEYSRFPVRVEEAYRFIEKMQNTGIGTSGKCFGRFKNFPPQVSSIQGQAKWLSPWELGMKHPAVEKFFALAKKRWSYVRRSGGTVGNGEAATGKQENSTIKRSMEEVASYIWNSIGWQIQELRREIAKDPDQFWGSTVQQWPSTLQSYLLDPESPYDAQDVQEALLEKVLRQVERWAAQQDQDGNPLLYDRDVELLQETLIEILENKGE